MTSFIRRALIGFFAVITSTALSGQQTFGEPPAPAATAAVQELLVQASSTANSDVAKALELAERARIAANQAGDVVGQAHAVRACAVLLPRLKRNEDALAAWKTAEELWRQVGDAPAQIEALGWQAVLEAPRDAAQAVKLLQRAITLAEGERVRPRAATRMLTVIGGALLDRSRDREAEPLFKAALTLAERVAPRSTEHAWAFNGLGNIAINRRDLAAAREYHERALSIREAINANSADVAVSTNNLGNIALLQGDLAAARGRYERARDIREKLEPNTLGHATSLYNLGIVAHKEGDFDRARGYFVRTLDIRQKLVPDTPPVASSLNSLGTVEEVRGDLDAARAYYQRALVIHEKWAPGSPNVATTLANLGLLADLQGDLASARDYYTRALAIFEQQSPSSLDVAQALTLLGIVAQQQGDFGAARDYQIRALEMRERHAPGKLDVAQSYVNLGALMLDEGNLDKAKELYARGLTITEQIAPNSPGIAAALASLGNVAERQGDFASARDYHLRALSKREAVLRDSLAVASSFHSLGTISRRQGVLQAAREYHQRALAIREKLAPSSLDLARSLSALGSLSATEGDVANAVEQTARAWAIVRAQGAMIAGDEARQAFEAHYRSICAQLVQLLFKLGKTDEAFAALEEGRAQALLAALGARGIARRLAPPELWQRYSVAQATSDRAGKTLEAAGLAEAQAKSSLDSEIAQLSAADVIQKKRGVLADQERKSEEARRSYARARVEAEQRWADVAQAIRGVLPQPMGFAEARRALPADTVLAAFAVGEETSTLFLVQRDEPVRAYSIAVSSEQLAARVKFMLDATSRYTAARAGLDAGDQQTRITAARSLFAQLFPADARALVVSARRLLLSPDGPLWDLPFAALVTNAQGTPQYLGLGTPLTYAQSLTTFAHTMQREAPAASKRSLVIVGNPLYDNALRGVRPTAPPQIAGAASRATGKQARGEAALLSSDGTIPPPLPFAELEADRIAALYGVPATTGIQPTETWFRQRAVDASVIHLATHGFFNPFRALSSGVLLAVPEQDPKPGETDNDGALQAWEVFTHLQLRAALVVLSACDSGVGSKGSAEGLVGLTRAFQVAGAASVVATQWKVQDQSTARTMVAFHQHLLKGASRDEALHLAMRQIAADPATKDPYFWAPFILVGDPRPMPKMTTR